jgi:S1-C subfamily serine protease
MNTPGWKERVALYAVIAIMAVAASFTLSNARAADPALHPLIAAAEAEAEASVQEPKYKLGIEFQPAMVIVAVEPGSLADKYGLVKGDIIIELNGQAPDSAVNFFRQVGKDLEEKARIDVRVLRQTPDGPRRYKLALAR